LKEDEKQQDEARHVLVPGRDVVARRRLGDAEDEPPTTAPSPLDSPPMMATASLEPSTRPWWPVSVTGATSTPAKAAAIEESA